MSNSFTQRSIILRDLTLWDENARFPDKYFHSDESSLISYFLSKPEFKIQQLVCEIIKDFDLPQLEKIIVWENNNKNIVLEGNRRLTVYKLLVNPQLAAEQTLISFIEQQKGSITIDDSYKLECLVTADKEEGFRYIDRKHANNNNEVNWQDVERAHYSVRRGSKDQNELIKIGITKVVRELDLPEAIKDQVLGKKYVTNFFRFVASGPAKEKYGLTINENGDLDVKSSNFTDELKIIIHNVLSGEDFNGKPINSRSLNKVTEINDYLQSIKLDDSKKVDDSIKNSTTENIFGDESIEIGTRNKKKILKKSTNRSYLIPQSCRLTITECKINNIYRELREDLLLDDTIKAVPNAVGVLFRVFLEINIDYFLEREGINLPIKTVLAGKITKCADFLEEKNIAKHNQLINIRKVATDKGSILGIQNFHDYVHSYKTVPCPNDLKSKWDNLEEFFNIIWDYHNRKK
jgi:hypothetical protein